MVVGFSLKDGKSTVELLRKNRANHLVGESHPGKGDPFVGTVVDGI
jgi:hypothetical protein